MKPKFYIYRFLFSLFLLLVCFALPAQCQTRHFSRDVLVDAFEKGRSLVAVQVLAVTAQDRVGGGVGKSFVYQVEVVKPIVAGDLAPDELKRPLSLHAGIAYGAALKVGSCYALFVIKVPVDSYEWTHRNDILELDRNNDAQLESLSLDAQKVYETTLISLFRRTKFSGQPKLPELSKELLEACQQFRKSSDRITHALVISTSPLGSRQDNSRPNSSIITYLPPALALTRQQVLFLWGEPNLKSGREYTWYCKTGESYGLNLVVNFNEQEQVKLLLIRGSKYVH